MFIIRIAIQVSILAGPVCGQTISFVRPINGMGYQQSGGTAVDASGVYAVGRDDATAFPGVGLVRKYDTRGNEMWSRRFEDKLPTSVAVSPAGSLYIAGVGTGLVREAFLSKLDALGNPVWTRQTGSGTAVQVTAADTGIYVAWTPEQGPRAGVLLRKFDANGEVLWTARPEFQGTFREFTFGLAANATGVYLSSLDEAGGYLRRYTAGGQEVWTRRIADRSPSRLALDVTGAYVVDTFQGLLRKYSLGGEELWNRQAGLRNSLAAVSVDASGVYVGGFVEKTFPGQCATGSYDAVVRRYTADGSEVWTRQFGLPGDAGGSKTDAGGTPEAVAIAFVAVDSAAVYLHGFTGKQKALLARLEKAAVVIPSTRPHIYWNCVVNAASYIGGGVAPGEMVTIFGAAMGPAEQVRHRAGEDGRLSTTLAETRILFNGVPAPLLYVSDRQCGAIVPYAVADGPSVEVQVEYRGVRSDAVVLPVLPSRPGIFSADGSGWGQGAILNEDGSVNSPSNPAARGSIVTIYATGGGEASPRVVDGQILGGALPATSLPVSAFFDLDYVFGEEDPVRGEVMYAGGSAGSVAGLLQVNVRVPSDALPTVPGDAIPLAIVIGSHSTAFQTTIALR